MAAATMVTNRTPALLVVTIVQRCITSINIKIIDSGKVVV